MRGSMRVVVLLAIAATGSPHAQPSGAVVESETGTSFPTTREFGGVAHTLIGVGSYEAFGAIDIYGAGYYVETESAIRSWRRFLERQAAAFVTPGSVNWAGLKDSTLLYQWISSSSFGRGMWFKFVRGATRQQVIDLHERIMRGLITDFDRVVERSPLKEYVDATCQDISDGDEMLLWTRGSTIWVKLGDRPLVRIDQASSIMRVVWGLWFGHDPIHVPLRRALVDRIESLGEPAPAE